ncbi:MAG TPA: hypothetical protein VHZ24_11060 [Pirellulales bacterium]|jgi:hypothetical protein|nr:hypothetical protein [Pirellulales bacterium]
MPLLRYLEQKLRPWAIPNLTLGLIAVQVAAYAFESISPNGVARLALVPDRVLAGEVWRLVTFLAVPPLTNLIFAFFFWYIFYMMGTALEQTWGALRYNLYLLIGYVATVAAALAHPAAPATNGFLYASMFLAFAWEYPDFEFYIFFILPIKVRWLALLQWIGYAFAVFGGDWLVLASVVNFFVFFGRQIVDRIRTGRRRMATQAQRLVPANKEPFHRCLVCGITDQTNPEMEFRYCSKCYGTCGYCSRHLHAHEHLPPPIEATSVGSQ